MVMNNFSFLKKVFTTVLSYESNIHLFNTNSRDYVLYATYCLINSFAPILFTNNAYDSISIIISYISGSACVFLLLNETWPENIKKYLIIYWYITVLFTLPVHSIFTVLSSSSSFDKIPPISQNRLIQNLIIYR